MKSLNKGFLWLALLLVQALGMSARAEDIDIFAYNSNSSASSTANVLFVIDNGSSANSSNSSFYCGIDGSGNVYTTAATVNASNQTAFNGKNFAVAQCALYSVLKALSSTSAGSTLNVGVMMFNANGLQSYDPATNTFANNCRIASASIGGCLVVPFTQFSGTNATRILAWIKAWVGSGSTNYNILGSGLANGATMQEAWAYFKGRTGISGRNYSAIAPAAATTCTTTNNVIFIGNAYANNTSPSDSTGDSGPKNALLGTNSVSAKNASPASTSAERALMNDSITSQCGTKSLPTGNNAENGGAYALNWARYMKNQHEIKSYSIGILGPTCNADYAANLTKLGAEDVGGGRYFATTDFSSLTVALQTVLSEILAVDSVYASVSLPVSTSTQGQFLNQIFVGLFRPQGDFLPRWTGNLKQYKLGPSTGGGIEAQDADGNSAINATTGFLSSCARSFWTPTATDTYWANDPVGTCQGVTGQSDAQVLKGSNYPDGEVVEKGGQAYRLRSGSVTPSTRNVKTCAPGSSCTTLVNFNTSLATATYTQALFDPAASGAVARNTLIDWARGTNNKDSELSMASTAMRASVHGDVIHSRPVAINHGDDTTSGRRVVVYYGANDGMLRAVNGNQTGSVTYAVGGSTFAAGDELWSFMPPEFFGSILRLYNNSNAIRFPGTTVSSSTAKSYGMDGPISSFLGTISGSSKIYVFSTMRRGGRAIYAFDVTTRPDVPTLLWRQGCPNLSNDTGCTTGFTGIGQTWGTLKATKTPAFTALNKPLLIMAGGYDTCEDSDTGTANHSCTATGSGLVSGAAPKGRSIYVLDATTGAVIREFTTSRPVVGDATIVSDSSGNAIYAYAADLGGNVYRICFVNGCGNSPSSTNSRRIDWTITRIASVGCSTSTNVSYTAPTDTANASSTSTVGGGYGVATSPCAAPRKVMQQPSVVTADNVTYYVFVGTGDREKPVTFYAASQSVTNYFFQIKDRPGTSNWFTNACPNGPSGSANKDVACLESLTSISAASTSSPSAATLAASKGWYLGLLSGEQVVTAPLTVFGVTTFSTNTPQTSTCGANLGLTKVYNVSYLDASTTNTTTTNRFETVTGGGLPPSPVAGRVQLDNGNVVPFCVGCSAASPLAGALPRELNLVTQPKQRLYWYPEK